jgi:very-short-patch-repair endonuclease
MATDLNHRNQLNADPVLLAHARELRHPQTPAGRKIWASVRNNQLGPHFRRQHPIWRFIVDFYCASARLIVEIDGDTHAETPQVEYDAARTRWLESRGYRIIRFTNRQVGKQLDAVLETIAEACRVNNTR